MGGSGSVSLEQRLAGHLPDPSTRRVRRESFTSDHRHGLRARLQRSLDDAVLIFETDRLIYDIEVDAQHQWLERLAAFDAYYARRAAGDGPPDAPVR
jgi:hypothetical protein